MTIVFEKRVGELNVVQKLSIRSLATSLLFGAFIFVLGCALWSLTGSTLDATIVMVTVGAGFPFALWFYLNEK